ncbi:MAG TPA: hypothetical protein VIK12_04585 [Pengzhenrongella sp.]
MGEPSLLREQQQRVGEPRADVGDRDAAEALVGRAQGRAVSSKSISASR